MRAFRSGEGRPFTRLSDKAGGGLALGGIGTFDEDPGADYIKPDGAARLVADFPELAQILPVGSKMRKATGVDDVQSVGNYGQTILVDPALLSALAIDGSSVAAMLRSTDRGVTYARGAPAGGLPRSIARFGSTSYWYALKSGNFAQTTNGLAFSNNQGLNWNDQTIQAGSTVTTVAMFFLGPPWNLMIVTAPSNQNVMWYASTAGGAFTGVLTAIASCYAGAVNPTTGTTIFAAPGAVRRRANPLDPNTTSTPGVDKGTLGGVCVRYAAGLFVVVGANGIYVSRDDGNSFTQVSSLGAYCCDYGNGMWLFGSGNGTMFVGNGSLSAVSALSFIPLSGSNFAFTDVRFTGTSWVAAISVLGGLFYSLTADPLDGFVVVPFLSDTGLIAPKKFYMRVR